MSTLAWLVACIGLLSSLQALSPVSAVNNSSTTVHPSSTPTPMTTSVNHSTTPTVSMTASLLVTASSVISVTPTPTPTPSPSKSSAVIKTSTQHVKPTSTPTPPPPPPDCFFTIFYNNTVTNETCFRMQGCLALEFSYYNTTKGQKNTKALNLTKDDFRKNMSTCGNETAYIIFNVTNSTNVFLLNLTFTANKKKGSQGWSYHSLTLNYTIKDNTTFSDFVNNSKLVNKTVKAHLNQSLFDESNSIVEFERPYRCNASLEIPFTDNLNVTAFSFNTMLDVSLLRVQVFEFRKPGEFGVDRYCVHDSSGGSKIVPIAVGAALGALVIIILCAYLISQFVARRKKTTYEPLN